MPAYADTSFLVRIYTPHADSLKALNWLQKARQALPFTQIHRHELRNAIRLRVFRGEISSEQRKLALAEIESDLNDDILRHTPISWTEAFRQAEDLGAAHTEELGVRSIDLLHVAVALTLGATELLTYDERQASLAQAAGLKIKH
jgi:predicted nucleic acid-binding protein